MKRVTRIPVQTDSQTLQAANFFDALRQRGKLAALIVPDMYTAQMIRKALALSDKCVFAATEPGARWILGRAFEVYVIANETLCAEAVHRELPGEGEFIHLLAARQSPFPDAHIYAFTEARQRVTTDTQRKEKSMQMAYIPEVVMPTEDEIDGIAQQVISEAKAVFRSGALLSGAPLAEEIAARIKQRIKVSLTAVPLPDDRPADCRPFLMTVAEWLSRRRALEVNPPRQS